MTTRQVKDQLLQSGAVVNFVTGPASATNNDFAQFDGTTGKILKDGGYSPSSFDAAGAAAAALVSAKSYADAGDASTLSAAEAYSSNASNLTSGTVAAARLPGSFNGFANPSASVGLSAINGSAATAMRSDAAPALDQSISPTWSGTHTWSNPLQAPVGSASAPSITFTGHTGYGFFYDTTNSAIGIAFNGAQTGWFTNRGLQFQETGSNQVSMNFLGENTIQWVARRYSNDTVGPLLLLEKSRGTIASPAVAQLNDVLGQIFFYACTATAPTFTPVAGIAGKLIETGTVSPSACGSQMTFNVTPIGSGSNAEIMRLESGTGLSMFGANPVIDQNRTHILRSCALASEPTGTANGLIQVTDDGAGSAPYYYDASRWRRINGKEARVSTQFNTTSTTLADVTGLNALKVEAGRSYRFRAVLFCDADAVGGQKYAIAGTATATAIIYQITTISNASNLNVITSRQTALGGSAGQAGSTGNYTIIEGEITVNAAGTLTVQFAQNAAGGTSSILVGSTFTVTENT